MTQQDSPLASTCVRFRNVVTMDMSCCFNSLSVSFSKRLLTAIVSVSLLASCGGGSELDSAATPDLTPTSSQSPGNSLITDRTQTPGQSVTEVPFGTTVLSGIFLDSPVENLPYTTASQSGITDEQGRFNYIAGETIVFSIGNIEFPPVDARDIITPVDLFSDGTVNHRGVVNISRLLQTLDSDDDLSNGILRLPGLLISIHRRQLISNRWISLHSLTTCSALTAVLQDHWLEDPTR